MEIIFSSDDDLSLKKTLEFHNMVVAGKTDFNENR